MMGNRNLVTFDVLISHRDKIKLTVICTPSAFSANSEGLAGRIEVASAIGDLGLCEETD